MGSRFFKRNVEEEFKAFFALMPVVLIVGARQSGKTTFIQQIAADLGIPIFTFDDEFTLSNAKRDPSGWLASLPKPVAIDEVQRAPEIFLSIKRDVDQNRGSRQGQLKPQMSTGTITCFTKAFVEKFGVGPSKYEIPLVKNV